MAVTQIHFQYQYAYEGVKDPSGLVHRKAPDVYRVIAVSYFPSAAGST